MRLCAVLTSTQGMACPRASSLARGSQTNEAKTIQEVSAPSCRSPQYPFMAWCEWTSQLPKDGWESPVSHLAYKATIHILKPCLRGVICILLISSVQAVREGLDQLQCLLHIMIIFSELQQSGYAPSICQPNWTASASDDTGRCIPKLCCRQAPDLQSDPQPCEKHAGALT